MGEFPFKVYLYFIFRVLVGGLFFMHGAQKLFGWFGASGTVELVSLIGLAGIIEFAGGLLIVLGLFTRYVAMITAAEMLVAFFKAHFPQGWNPLLNSGELSLLYFSAFLVLIVLGARMWSLDRVFFDKR